MFTLCFSPKAYRSNCIWLYTNKNSDLTIKILMKIKTSFMFGWGGKVCIVIKAKCTRAWFKWSKKLPQKWWKIVDGIVGPLWSNEETVTFLKWLHEINRLMLPAVYLGEPSLNGMGGNVKSFAFYPVAFHHILMKVLPEYSGFRSAELSRNSCLINTSISFKNLLSIKL